MVGIQENAEASSMSVFYDNVVIGGSGFIGTSLIRALLKKGEIVANVSFHIGNFIPGVDVILLDVENADELEGRLPQGETVYILIGQTGPGFDVAKELLNLKNIIRVLNKNSPKRVFYISSTRVYGETTISAAEESVLRPYDDYSRFKRDAETLFQGTLDSSICLGIIRLSNVYGNPKNRGFVNTIMEAARGGARPLGVYGNGGQSLDYIHVDDVADAIVAIEERLTQSDVVNVATGNNHSVIDLIAHISRINKKQIPYSMDQSVQPEVRISNVSNRKLREKYGFKPHLSLDSGLLKALDAYKAPMPSARKKVLLLGGEGFIGRNLAVQLLENYDCFSAGKEKSPWPERKDVFVQFDPYKHDLRDSYDAVVHLIDHQLPLCNFEDAEQDLLRHIQIQPPTHLVLISSYVLYAQPDSEYALRKKLLEEVYTEYCRAHSVPLTIARLFNVYGPYQYPGRAGSLVANIFTSYLEKKRLHIRDMSAKRDFIYAPDVARIIEEIIINGVTGTFDVCTGTLTSIASLVDLIERDIIHDRLDIESGKDAEMFICPAAEKRVGLSVAPTDLIDGLRHTFIFYLKNKKQ